MKSLGFKTPYVDLIKSSAKTTTIRQRTNLVAGDVIEARCRWGQPPFAYLRVKEITYKAISDLTDDDALADGFESRQALVATIREFYPQAETVAVISFVRVRRPRGASAPSLRAAAR